MVLANPAAESRAAALTAPMLGSGKAETVASRRQGAQARCAPVATNSGCSDVGARTFQPGALARAKLGKQVDTGVGQLATNPLYHSWRHT
jgi:hypothetical protein